MPEGRSDNELPDDRCSTCDGPHGGEQPYYACNDPWHRSRHRRRYGACRHCGIVVVRELDLWIGSLSGSHNCQRSPSRRHEAPVVAAEFGREARDA